VTGSSTPSRLTLCFELNLPGKYVLAIENAVTTNPNAKMPIPVECMGNHHLLLDRPLAIRGTSIPAGKKNMVASAPHTICAMRIDRLVPELETTLPLPLPLPLAAALLSVSAIPEIEVFVIGASSAS
jgi:hypothetical protein